MSVFKTLELTLKRLSNVVMHCFQSQHLAGDWRVGGGREVLQDGGRECKMSQGWRKEAAYGRF